MAINDGKKITKLDMGDSLLNKKWRDWRVDIREGCELCWFGLKDGKKIKKRMVLVRVWAWFA